jgi:hypothetical protein
MCLRSLETDTERVKRVFLSPTLLLSSTSLHMRSSLKLNFLKIQCRESLEPVTIAVNVSTIFAEEPVANDVSCEWFYYLQFNIFVPHTSSTYC